MFKKLKIWAKDEWEEFQEDRKYFGFWGALSRYIAWHDTWYKYTKVFRYLKRVAEYTPVLWDDRDYDGEAILAMLAYKIKRTREHLTKHSILMPKTIARHEKQMKEAEALIERITSDFHETEAHEAFYDKYPKLSYWYRAAEVDDMLDAITMEDKIVWTAKQSAEFKAGNENAVKRKKEDWERLTYIMKKYLEKWWD